MTPYQLRVMEALIDEALGIADTVANKPAHCPEDYDEEAYRVAYDRARARLDHVGKGN
jgi:hypothetical protein